MLGEIAAAIVKAGKVDCIEVTAQARFELRLAVCAANGTQAEPWADAWCSSPHVAGRVETFLACPLVVVDDVPAPGWRVVPRCPA